MRKLLILTVALVLTSCGGIGGGVVSKYVWDPVGEWLLDEVLGLSVEAKSGAGEKPEFLVKQFVDSGYKLVAPHAEQAADTLSGLFSRNDRGYVTFMLIAESPDTAKLWTFRTVEDDTVWVSYDLTRAQQDD